MVGIGQGKSREVAAAIGKATNRARKNLIEISPSNSLLSLNKKKFFKTTFGFFNFISVCDLLGVS